MSKAVVAVQTTIEKLTTAPIGKFTTSRASSSEPTAGYARRKHEVAVNSGTSGPHLLVRAFGIGEGDEVNTTPFSFIAFSSCILYERAEPVFVNIEPDTANIDPNFIEDAITPRDRKSVV